MPEHALFHALALANSWSAEHSARFQARSALDGTVDLVLGGNRVASEVLDVGLGTILQQTLAN